MINSANRSTKYLAEKQALEVYPLVKKMELTDQPDTFREAFRFVPPETAEGHPTS